MMTDEELLETYEQGEADCPPLQNDTHLWGLRAVRDAVAEAI